jgi:serine/threonine protein kinase
MPAPATVAEFLDLVRKSGLLPDARLDEVIDRHRAANALPQTIDQFAALLVREGLLTFFQAKQLKLGRYKRFTIGSKYRLLELIGAGGMGAVYLCEHTLMKRLVALKVLPVEKLDESSNLERFHREARAVAALDHPNIVRAYDIDQHEKLHFLVMEYVDGNSLQEIVARHGPMDPVRTAHYVAQAAVGIQHAHELGMVHRDIKPGNLLLDRTGVIKVLDMGLARFFNKPADSVTEKYDQNCVLGTADYLAPEQAVSNQVDIRADVYGLGGTMYFMLTGQTPFTDATIAAKLVAHQTREPRPVEAYRSDVPPEMMAILRKMMSKDPADRYQEPIEVAEALAEWADQEVGLPPAKEMPGLCPLVLSLTGHSVDKSGSQVPLARALFGPGRSVFRGGSSSAIRTQGGSKSGVGTANPGGTKPAPGRPAAGSSPGNRKVAVGGPVSTARTTAAATAPIPSKVQPPLAMEDEPPAEEIGTGIAMALPPHRTRLYILLAAAFALLLLGAIISAVAAYYLGKSNKTEAESASGRRVARAGCTSDLGRAGAIQRTEDNRPERQGPRHSTDR